MYAYWYEEGQLMSYEGTWEHFKDSMNINSYYLCESFKDMSNEWLETVVVNGCKHVFSIFAEDVPSDIKAMHLLLVKE